MIKSVFKFFTNTEQFPIKSFSYYLPAPPKRKSGYQEKEFDRIIDHLREKNYELIDTKIHSHNCDDHGGIWIFCRLRPLTRIASNQEINIDYQELAGSQAENIKMDPDIIHES
ncbi:MAG: hypothetical protein KC478_11105 [Bacteriovoracaceae bacterium]|nr:hypothetical protein [Bacteriovoracaceae bacterium]